MINKQTIVHKRFRAERSAELAAACDITPSGAVLELYDLAMDRVYARTALLGCALNAENVSEQLARLVITSAREHGVPASAVKSVGIAAHQRLSMALEDGLSAGDLYLSPDTEIYFMPFISAGISGRFTASLLTVPDEEFTAADIGSELCVAQSAGGELRCASFGLSGAFDGSGLESGMFAEKGAIDIVRRDADGTVAYEVVDDADSAGISPSGAVTAALLMLNEGILDSDGIMSDRDLFYIGEDFFVSQSDIRAIQADKARTAAALSLFEPVGRIFLSGEAFSTAEGLKAMLKLGAIPESWRGAGFCRNSVLRGVENCLKSASARETAEHIAKNSKDVTEKLLDEFDGKYLDKLSF